MSKLKPSTHCVFCHREFSKPSNFHKRFCGSKCTCAYSTIKKRIFSVYSGDDLMLNLARLEEFGDDYTFDEMQLNMLYNLGEWKRVVRKKE